MGKPVNQIDIGTLDIYFNELSVKEAKNKEIAREWIVNLVRVYKTAVDKGFKGFKSSGTLLEELIAENYTIGNWLLDKGVDRDFRLLFKTQFLKYPFIEDLLDKKSSYGRKLYEFKYNEKIAKGLGAAYLFNSLAVSLDNDIQWDTISINLDIFYYSDKERDIIETKESVRHVSKSSHFIKLDNWIEELKKISISNGKILWLKRRELFPHLVFCKNVKDKISLINKSDPELIQIIKRLFELEKYFYSWKTGPFAGSDLPSKVSMESESRLKKLKKQLTFTCEDGKTRLFSWHSRYTPTAGRIYFFPDEKRRQCHIGYIGQKIQ